MLSSDVYIPIWTIKDMGDTVSVQEGTFVYIPIWTIKDRLRMSKSRFRCDVYIPIWTIKDLFTVRELGYNEIRLHSNMDD